MAQSPDHPDLPFVEARQAKNSGPMYTPGRRGKKPIFIVMHDMEYPERADAAEWTANYFHTGAGGRNVSSHYTCDRDSIVQCVLLKDSAWTVGNREGNDEGINWELAGYASQTRAQWLDDYGRAMLTRIVPYMQSDARRFGIPLRTLTDAQVRQKMPGITSHVQLGRVFGGSDHTDPGPNFPWDFLLALLNNQGVPEMYRFFINRAEPAGGQSVYQFDGTDTVTGLGRLIGVKSWDYATTLVNLGYATMADLQGVDPKKWTIVKPSTGPVDLSPVLEAIAGVSDQVQQVADDAVEAAREGANLAEDS